jgi:glycerate 2-kinase
LNTAHATVPDVVVVPNCLRGYASAADVAAALARGVRQARPGTDPVSRPLADGGDGMLDALQGACGGTRHSIEVADLFGRPHKTGWLALDQRTAAVETAAICGLGALRPDELRPLRATSAGTGQAIAAAVAAGATTILLGLGGTAVVDGGAGALAALGARFLDRDSREVDPIPERLPEIAAIDLSPARRLLLGVTLRLLADVRTPLAHNLDSFGPQKGMTAENRPAAVRALCHLTGLLTDAGDRGAVERFRAPWFGAGGGVGFGLSAVVVATAGSGAKALLEAGDPDEAVATAGLALTAEGAVDPGTWQGKLPGAVAALRQERGLPTAVVALRFTGPGPGPLVSSHLIAKPSPVGPVTGPALWRGLAEAARRACRTWPRRTRQPQSHWGSRTT